MTLLPVFYSVGSRGLAGQRVWAHLFLTPSSSLYRWLLPQRDACAIERLLGAWVPATRQAGAEEPLALDGKTVRGASTSEQQTQHPLSFATHQSQETFFQVRVGEKTNETRVAKEVLPTLAHPPAGLYRRCLAHPCAVPLLHS